MQPRKGDRGRAGAKDSPDHGQDRTGHFFFMKMTMCLTVDIAMIDASHAESEYPKEIKEAKIKKYISIDHRLQRTHRPQSHLLGICAGKWGQQYCRDGR